MSTLLTSFLCLTSLSGTIPLTELPIVNYVWRPGGGRVYPTVPEVKAFLDAHPEAEAAQDRKDRSILVKSEGQVFFFASDLDQLVFLRLKCEATRDLLAKDPFVKSNTNQHSPALADLITLMISDVDPEIVQPPTPLRDLNFILVPQAKTSFQANGRVFSSSVTSRFYQAPAPNGFAAINESKKAERAAYQFLDEKPMLVVPNAIDDRQGFLVKANERRARGEARLTRFALSVGRQHTGSEPSAIYEEAYTLAVKVLYRLIEQRKSRFESENAAGFARWRKQWPTFDSQLIWPPQGMIGQQLSADLQDKGIGDANEMIRGASNVKQSWGLALFFNTKPIDSPRMIGIWP